MGSIIAVANQKGGVGKTTISVHLAAWLVRQGFRVALVDGDPQGNATSWVLGKMPENSALFDLLVAKQPLRKVIQPVSGRWNLALLPGNIQTGEAMIIQAALRRPFVTVAQALRPLAEFVSYVLIDMPPSKAAGFNEMLFAADWALVPTQMERFALEGVVFMARTCQDILSNGRGPRLLGVVPNLVRRAGAGTIDEHKAQMVELVQVFGQVVWPPIAQTVRISEASSRGLTMFDYAPRHEVTASLALLGQRVVENTGGAING